MARSLPKVASRARRKKTLKMAKGYWGRRSKTIKAARQNVEKAHQYAFRDRKRRKRDFRSLWIARLNAAVRAHDMTYAQFVHGMKLAGVTMDRKVLSDLAIHEPQAFAQVVEAAKTARKKAA